MDSNNWRAAQAPMQIPGQAMSSESVVPPGMEAGDWRSQLQPDSRQRIVNKIMETLKSHLPFSGQEGLQELKKIAVRFEEKIFTAATNQSDYLRKISLKMLTMEAKSQNPMTNPRQPNTASNSQNPQDPGDYNNALFFPATLPASQTLQSQMQNQVQSLPMTMVSNQSQVRQQLLSQNIQNNLTSTGAQLPSGGMSQGAVPNVSSQNPNMQNIQNMSNVTQNVVGNSMGQNMQSNMFANSQRQMGRQQVASQDQQQQSQTSQQYPYNQQLQQHLMKQKFQQGTVQQSLMQAQIQQQQTLLQPGQLQSSQQTLMQPSLRQSSASSTLQQNQQQSLQQSTQSMHQQQPQSVLRQQQPSVMHQQPSSMPQHSVLPAQQHQTQQLSGQQPNASNMQQNQMIGQQNNALDAQQQHQQQRIMAQQNNIASLQPSPQTINQQNNLPNMHQQLSTGQQNNLQNVHQQQLGSQTNLSGFQQQQMAGIQNGSSSLQPNTQPVHMLQQSKISAQQQMQQNMTNLLPSQAHQSQSQPPQQLMSQIQSQQGQLQQQLGLQQQANPLQRDMQQRIQTSGPLLQPHNTIDQQKQLLQSQRIIPEVPLPSLDSSAQTGNSNGGDWQEEVYQKIKSMNDMYFSELNEMYQRMAAKLQQHDSLPQQPKNEQLDKLRFYKVMLERLLMFLQTNKNEVNLSHKEKIVGVEKQIVNVINSNRPRKAVSSSQQGQIPQPHLPAVQQSQQPQPQISQIHMPENQMNSQMQPMNVQNSVSTAQQNNLNNLQHNSLSSVSTVSNSRQNMMDTLQPGSNVEPGQGNSLNSIQQLPMNSLQQNLVLQGGSPQISHHPSPQLDQQNLLASQVKAGTPLQSANSPFVAPSPSTSIVPSPMPGESEKNLGVSSLSNAGNIVHHSTAGPSGPAQSLAIGTPGISASPLLAEFTSPDGTHGAASTIVSGSNNVVERPLDRLIKVVKSMSQKALSASVSDISSVVSMVDRIAGSAPGNGSRAAVGEDLVAMTKCRLQARNYFTQDGPSGTKKMRRYTSAMPSNVVSSTCSVSDNFRHINGSESDGESTGASSSKRPRIEANHALEEEIHEINQRLIDTAVYISEDDVDPTAVAAAAEGGGGTIVKCSFSAVALSPNLKSQYASAQMSPIQPLRLLVPNNYPNCSPILLDKFPVEVSKEYEDLSRKAKARFSISLRALAQPMSLGDIARTWDICARAVISEYAQQSGGGTFSSKYGTWEDCLSTA
ncbi:mediator of RNA polymerase II transcription subunit 15a [Dorcoceras hygrometricum]|uniref:Mediator of RNA polymerase II transcription subunit 15a n=1 Tax=Dorcoceras hygrometricum TaxID=472368 RepID=A0A2Z7CJN7_9LAMI|nr:mediator of RNA polymerase II transcription subunit 15a [Dorcoceras hygrometricum]